MSAGDRQRAGDEETSGWIAGYQKESGHGASPRACKVGSRKPVETVPPTLAATGRSLARQGQPPPPAGCPSDESGEHEAEDPGTAAGASQQQQGPSTSATAATVLNVQQHHCGPTITARAVSATMLREVRCRHRMAISRGILRYLPALGLAIQLFSGIRAASEPYGHFRGRTLQKRADR